MTITENTKLTFGKHKGKPLKNCPLDYLEWLHTNLKDGDFCEWAIVAGQVYEMLKEEGAEAGSLEQQANEFLRKHGVDYKRL